MDTIVKNNKVIRYNLLQESEIIGVPNTYEKLKVKFFLVSGKINRFIDNGKCLPKNMFYLHDQKEFYIKQLKRIENVYCLKPF